MSLFVSWIAFPFVLGVLCLGGGLLVERLAGKNLPGVLLLPIGLATVVVVTQLATNWDATAELAMPALLLVAVIGLWLGRARMFAFNWDRWAVVMVAALVAALAAPVVLSGHATLAGYNLNGEPSIHMIGIDRLMEHGRDLTGLAPSTFQFCLDGFFGSGYPSGAQTALGGVRPLIGGDVFWIYQPFLVFLITMAALSLYSLITPLVQRRWLRALVVFVAAQPALVYGFSLQGSIKELSALFALTLLFALVPLFVRDDRRNLRAVVPLAVATAAGMGVINIAILPWLGVILLATVLMAWRAAGWSQWKTIAKQAAAFVALAGVLSYPALSVAGTLYSTANDQLTAQSDLTAARGLGNLVRPLESVQTFGIWLNGDYRYPVEGRLHDLNYLLIGIAIAAALIGLVWVVRSRRRAAGVLLYGAASAIACVFIVSRGSPWADGKALTITAPAALLFAMLGAAALIQAQRRWVRVVGLALAGAVAGGVLLSNALAYHQVNLAPQDRIAALEKIGKKFSGQGPTVYFEFEEYGKHFLRDTQPDGRTDTCQPRFLKQRDGTYPPAPFAAEPDNQTSRYMDYYRTIVLRRSAEVSRPPSNYKLVYADDYYEVWQRPTDAANQVVEHLPLQGSYTPSARPPCSQVQQMARKAKASGDRLAYVARPKPIAFIPARHAHPGGWPVDGSEPDWLVTNGPGRVGGTVTVPRAGEYNLWLGGSFGRAMKVTVDGQPVGTVSYQLNGRDQFAQLDTVRLAKGRHVVVIDRGGGDLRPGNGGSIRSLGPMIFEPVAAQQRKVIYIDPSDAKRVTELCKLDLDWVEIVKR